VFAARIRRAVEAVLREGDELQVDIGRDLRFTSSSASTASSAVVAGVDMGADGEQAHRDRQSQ
jgi:phosphomannomutase